MSDDGAGRTEQELLDMSAHFRKLLEKKNVKIERLCKTIALCYGLTRAIEEDPECATILVSTLHQYLSLEVENLMDINSGD
jgi:hypothetical protein